MIYFNEFTLIGELTEINDAFITLKHKQEFINEKGKRFTETNKYNITYYQINPNIKKGNNIKVTGFIQYDHIFNENELVAITIELYE